MAGKSYKKGKRGAGRHVQLPEYLQATEAWATLKPGPRALYIELKRRFNGSNNGRIILSHRDAASALNVHRNTVGPWFAELEQRGFIAMVQGPHLGPAGIGQAALWALTELPTADGRPASRAFRSWRVNQKPRTKSEQARRKEQDSPTRKRNDEGKTVLKAVGQLESAMIRPH